MESKQTPRSPMRQILPLALALSSVLPSVAPDGVKGYKTRDTQSRPRGHSMKMRNRALCAKRQKMNKIAKASRKRNRV